MRRCGEKKTGMMLRRWWWLAVLACGLVTMPAQAATSPLPPTVAHTFGEECSPCHGRAGEGRIGPQLAGHTWPALAFTAQVRNGGLVMPAFPASQLSDRRLAALMVYVNQLPAPAPSAILPAPKADAPGAALFQTDCFVCHGAEGRGAIGPGILNTALSLPRFTAQVRHGGGPMPAFAPPMLSESQLKAIYAYLHPRLGPPDRGTVDPLPSVPNYPAAFFFGLAILGFVVQLLSLRRRRARLELAAQAERLRDWLDESAGAVRAQVY